MRALFSPSWLVFRLTFALCATLLSGRTLAADDAPSSSPPAESAEAGAKSSKPSSLSAETLQSMVIVEGKRGRGSAFVVQMDGRTYVVTNSHVVRGNDKLKFKKLNNEELAFGPLEIAEHEDLVRAELQKPSQALELLPHEDQQLKIGDEVVVVGNSEGAGVVRELAGKIVGLGPDRIEVDATFVPGNSGSPILLKSTKQVVGVATYVNIPYFFRRSASTNAADQPITSLNEVRRFGYSLDTVAKWIKPEAADGIVQEGMKLGAMEEMGEAIASIVNAGATSVSGVGSAGFIHDERKTEPHFKELAAAIDEFATKFRAAKEPEEKKAPFQKLFEQLDAATQEDIKGETPEKFSGFYAEQFKEVVEWRKGMHEWLDFVVHRPDKDSWIDDNPWMRRAAPVVDLAKLNLTLTESVDPAATPERHHRVVYPVESKPASVENIFWIEQAPNKEPRAVAMHASSLRLNTPVNGIYRVSLEYRAGKLTRKISNVVEVNVTDIPQPNVEVDFAKGAPLEVAADDKPGPPDWELLDKLMAAETFAKTPFIGHEGSAGVIKDLPAAGAVLIGFDCVIAPFRKSTETVHGVRPVYLTRNGQKDGQVWGGKNGESNFRIVAKPGYAVGRVSGQFDGVAIRRLKVRFDRIYGLKLNPKESYETEWIGEYDDAQETSVDTNGHLPVGLSGKSGAGLDGIRLVCLTSLDPNAVPAAPGAAASPAPETFDSLDAILKIAPTALLARLDDKDTREDAVKQLNQFFAANVKGKPLAMRVTVESAEPVNGGEGRFAIKLPDGRTALSTTLGTKVWVYFQPDDAPKDPISIGAKVRVSGVIGRCDITPGNRPLLHVDLGQSKLVK